MNPKITSLRELEQFIDPQAVAQVAAMREWAKAVRRLLAQHPGCVIHAPVEGGCIRITNKAE